MKAKLLKSITNNGEIPAHTEVEIADACCGCDGYYYTCIIPDGRQININSNLLEVIDYTPYIDWEERRYELAKAAMQGILSNQWKYVPVKEEEYLYIANKAVNYADALIKELKKK